MNPIKQRFPAYHTLSGREARQLSGPCTGWNTVEVRPSGNSDHPATLGQFIRGIRELQTAWLGLKNVSPTASFEMRRHTSDSLRFQFSAPTKRLERKIRTHLRNQLPDAEFSEGTDSVPVSAGDSLGGGLLTVGRRDWYPLQTEFDKPPTNSLVGALHRHVMEKTGIIIQVLFRPVIGSNLTRWWRDHRIYQHIGYLRKEKEKLWHSRKPTPREKQQADAIERKAGTPRFYVSIRLLFTNGQEYTPSRVKELAGAFNVYENPDTGQYLNAVTVRTLSSRILSFASAVKNRRFGNWHRRFQASTEELAALVAVPDRNQQNIRYAKP